MDSNTVLQWMRDNVRAKLPTSLVTYFLFCIFGIGSWIAINGIWAEISILVLTLPECAKLPAILVVVIQVANVGPLAYTIVKYLFRRFDFKQIHLEVCTVILLVVLGITSCILLALLWSETAEVFGSDHSVALIVLAFCLSLVDCTSSVVFIPFMKHFPSEYISGLYIGEGLSGVFPSIVALSQGFVKNSINCTGSYSSIDTLGIYFSPSVYFVFLSVMMGLCGLAFLAINTLPMVRKHMIPYQAHSYDTLQQEGTTREWDRQGSKEDEKSFSDTQVDSLRENTPSAEPLVMQRGSILCRNRPADSTVEPSCYQLRNVLHILQSNFIILFCLSLLSFLTNGSLIAISAYAFIPYGNEIYHTAVNLGLLATPIAAFVFVLVSRKSKLLTVVLTIVACLLGIYVLVAALLSPNPPLVDSVAGKILIVSPSHPSPYTHTLHTHEYCIVYP